MADLQLCATYIFMYISFCFQVSNIFVKPRVVLANAEMNLQNSDLSVVVGAITVTVGRFPDSSKFQEIRSNNFCTVAINTFFLKSCLGSKRDSTCN